MAYVSGWQKIVANLKLMDTQLHQEIEKTANRLVIAIASRSKEILTENDHIVTGNLKRSVKGEAKFINLSVVEGQVGTDVDYAAFVEALPDGGYLYRAYTEVMLTGERIFVQEVGAMLERGFI